ncbi:MAG TPA: hypothetical protein PKD86_06780 [Gemmatales bacterium]|nr:hypothetical protein [Gemmatales bacterium]
MRDVEQHDGQGRRSSEQVDCLQALSDAGRHAVLDLEENSRPNLPVRPP